MKIRNTSRLPIDLVRWAIAVARWALDEDTVGDARVWVRNRSRGAYSGHAWPLARRIAVSVGPDSAYPNRHRYRKSAPEVEARDAVEGLVAVLAHEFQHLAQKHCDEVQCEFVAVRAVDRSRAVRAEADEIMASGRALFTDEERAQRRREGQRKAAGKRLERLRVRLEAWEAKLKRAQAALKKLRPRLRAAEQRAAARAS